MCTITLSLAKRGEAIPGPYSSLTCFAGVRPGAVPERGEIEGHRHRRARWTFHSGQKTRHSGRCGACRKLSGEARDRLCTVAKCKWVASPDFLNSRSTPFTASQAAR